ncbi:hypothetical protein ACFOTA_11115 [Chitinophaga sp. GCM10012297]|uniref:Lipoprotein n=1 Tax=Chitinophaga chungangae TaxID=2821488 RepID=A0ABS3YDK7_9BACT|nr:hypothetical protein [Chitinophaga chungangae]MBO9152759.1 hypothetical protein [Chitinophaga chungangae]
MPRDLLKFFTAIGCTGLLLSGCSDYNPNAVLNCEQAAFNLANNGTFNSLKLLSANMLRNENVKLLSVEAYQDSIRVILNLSDTRYSGNTLRNDSLHTGDYIFSLRNQYPDAGKVVIGVKNGKDYTFLSTDTSSITIREMDVANRNLSGSYYVETVNPVMKLSGVFSKVCFQSIQ